MRTFFTFIMYVALMAFMTFEVYSELHGDYYAREVPHSVTLQPESLYVLPEYDYATPELECLAQNIYHEARNQTVDGMIAVAAVTINRVNSQKYADNICDVVAEPYQFSWVMQNKKVLMDNSIERQAWRVSQEIALMVLTDGVPYDMLGVMHYHADYVAPSWAERKTLHKVIANHMFYTSL